jgi:2,3-bisphosphoglycerate-dependent phosphoglycerate mutase
MRTLYVVTHPEATHHIEQVVGGQFDSDLTTRGRQQASAIANRLAEMVPADVGIELFTSDLKRTVQTAEAIATTLDLSPVLMSDLREKSYGIAGGKPQQWLDDRFIFPPAVGERMHHDEGIEGAETRAELAHRAYRAVDQILTHDCRHQIIVTHGTALTFVIAAWIRMPLEAADYVSFRSAGGGITLLREDDRYHYRTVESLSNTSYLTETS